MQQDWLRKASVPLSYDAMQFNVVKGRSNTDTDYAMNAKKYSDLLDAGYGIADWLEITSGNARSTGSILLLEGA